LGNGTQAAAAGCGLMPTRPWLMETQVEGCADAAYVKLGKASYFD
jgi:hypothetical protein